MFEHSKVVLIRSQKDDFKIQCCRLLNRMTDDIVIESGGVGEGDGDVKVSLKIT